MQPLTVGYDFDFFWRAASAILHGASPYSVPGFFSPHSLALLLTPLARLPFGLAYALWTLLKLSPLALPLSLLAGTNAIWSLVPLYLIFKDRFLPPRRQRGLAAPAPSGSD